MRSVRLALALTVALPALLGGCAVVAPGAGRGAETDVEAGPGWRTLSGGPLSGRTGAVVVGVDDTAYVIGGWELLCPPTADCMIPPDISLRDGAAVDLATAEWRRIAVAPVPLVHAEAGVVSGDVYVVAGRRLLRYDPVADAWSRLGPMPAGAGGARVLDWGGDLVLLSGTDEQGELRDHMYDPASGRWSVLPDDPLPATYDRFGVVDGDRLLVFGSPMVGPEDEAARKAVAAYTPGEGWTRLPDAPGPGYQAWSDGSRVWLNPHFFGHPGDPVGGGVLDLATDRWSPLPAGPGDDAWTWDMAGVFGEERASYEYAAGWVLDARGADPRWIEVSAVEPRLEEQSVAALGERLVAFGGSRWDGGYRDGELVDELWVWTPPGE